MHVKYCRNVEWLLNIEFYFYRSYRCPPFYDIADQVQLNLTAVTQYNQFVELSYDVQYE